MKATIILLLNALFILPLHLDAQKYTLRGALADSSGAPVVGATAMLLSPKDSALLAFSRSDSAGTFQFKNQNAGTFLLRCSFLGLQNLEREVRLDGDNKSIDLGRQIMHDKSKVLNELQVVGTRDPVKFKGDTIEFNAGSFKVKDNAMVEDLLKKLPGVEVDKDGTIKAQGEEVKNVTVEGKKFFGNDPKIATQNLPADAVDKVQVFDKKSEQATFSGVDDGQREKTINLELKEDKKKGWFGRMSAGGGSDWPDGGLAGATGRYESRLSLNSFKPKQQISLLGMGNNANQSGFSIDDYMAFSGAMRSMMGGGGRVSLQFDSENMDVPLDFGQNTGFIDTWAGGINFNREYGKRKNDFNASYFYSQSDRNYARNTNRQTFLPDGAAFNSTEESAQSTVTDNHRVNLSIDHKIDSFNSLQFSSGFVYTERSTTTQTDARTFGTNQMLQNDGARSYSADAQGANWTGNLLLRHKFKQKKGRNMSLNLNFGLNTNDLSSNSNARNRFYDDGGAVARDTVTAQEQRFLNDVSNWGAKATYTEPLGKKRYLEFNYGYFSTLNNADKDVYDLSNNERTFSQLFSNAYENTFNYHRGGLGYRINRKDWNLGMGIDAQSATLDGVISEGVGENVNRDYQHLLPRLNLHKSFADNKNLDFNYNAGVNAPTVQQLQPVPDVSDPLNISEGNPDLKPEYAHNFNLHFNQFDPETFRSFFGGVFGTYTRDRIVMAQSIDSQLVRHFRPLNVDYNTELSTHLAYGHPVKKWDSRFNISLIARLNVGPNYINGAENITTTTNYGPVFNWQFDPSEKVSFSTEARFNWNKTHYSIDDNFDQQYFSQEYSAELNLELPRHFGFNSNMTTTVNSGLSSGYNQAIPIWNASFSKMLLKNKSLELALVVRDILNRNVGITRNANLNYIEDQRTASLGRHAMLRLTYSLNALGGRGGGPQMRVRMIR